MSTNYIKEWGWLWTATLQLKWFLTCKYEIYKANIPSKPLKLQIFDLHLNFKNTDFLTCIISKEKMCSPCHKPLWRCVVHVYHIIMTATFLWSLQYRGRIILLLGMYCIVFSSFDIGHSFDYYGLWRDLSLFPIEIANCIRCQQSLIFCYFLTRYIFQKL